MSRTILRLEPLEQRRMLTVLGLDVELFSDSALSQPIAGDGNPIIETFVIQPGQDIFARITAEDLVPSSSAPGIVGLNLDVFWNRDEFGADAGDFMLVSDPPGNFGNPLPIGSPAVTAALPENRQGVLDNSQSRIDFLGGDIALGGTPIGIGAAENFSQIVFSQSALGVLSTVLTVDLGYCSFADGSDMISGDITPLSVRIRMNEPPLAVDHDVTTNEDAAWPLVGNVLVGCSDPEGTLLVVDGYQNPSTLGAGVDIDVAGNYTYTPTLDMIADWQHLAVGESVDDTFTYDIRDEEGGRATATVTVTVSGVNDIPVAEDDFSATDEDTPQVGNVLSNDTDVDNGDILSVSSFDAVSVQGAAVSVLADGSFVYDPTNAPNLQALPQGAIPLDDTFTYTVRDIVGAEATATVTVTVSGVNDIPVAVPDDRSTTEDEPISIDVLSNDTDVDTGHVLSLLSFDPTSQHQATITRDPGNPNAVIYNPWGKYRRDDSGNIVYDPAASDFLQTLPLGQSITDTFGYTVEDEHHATATATVTVEVNGLNDPRILAVKWEDLDTDGIEDTFELRLGGWPVFADLNHNGQLDDSSEPAGQTDGTGEVLFEYMLPGEYTIHEIIPDVSLGNRWAQTTPGSPDAPLPYVCDVILNDDIEVLFGNRESLHITNSSILQNDVVAAGNGFIAITFNRNLARHDWSDPAVWGHYFQLDSLILGQDLPLGDYIGGVTLASGGDQDPSVLTISFANLPDDSYTLTLKSGIGGFEDVYGNLLDGERNAVSTVLSGDALDGGDFRLHFVADLDTTDYPTQCEAVEPLGSMIYIPLHGLSRGPGYHIDPNINIYPADGTVKGYIGPAAAPYSYDPNAPIPADDTDSFVVSLDDKQTLTIIVEPLAPAYTDPDDPYIQFHELSPQVVLNDPGGTLMATQPTTGVNPERLIQTAAIGAAGDYTITVRGIGNTLGAYRLQVILNAAIEEETLGRGGNDQQAQAQDIDPSFIRLFDQVLLIPETGDIVQDSLASTPYICPQAVSDPHSSDVQATRNHAVIGGVLYYAAADTAGTFGVELWSYDGANHVMAADINPGAAGSFPSHFAAFNGELYFSAFDPAYGYELWKFDGNTLTRLTDINPGQRSSRPMYMAVYNDRLYFSADDGTHGHELWQYTPTAAAIGKASMVEDFNPGKFGSLSGPMTVFNGKLYFSADAGVHNNPNNDNIYGFELHVFDAANNAKITRVSDINPGMPSSHIQDIVVFGGEMFFRGNDGTHGWEAFKYDGAHDPVMLPDLNANPGGSWPGYFTVFRNRLFVVADMQAGGWQLLEYDGDQFNLAAGTGPGTIVLPDSPTVVGQYMFFSAENALLGRELWAYDGFELFLVDDYTPGTASTFDNSSPYRGFATLGDELFFRTFDYSGTLRYVQPTAAAQYHQTTSTRGAVLGTIDGGGEKDWYSFTLDDGQTATVALDMGQPGGPISLAVYRGATQLAVGAGGADNLYRIVENILDETADGGPDTYYVAVDGAVAGEDYRLIVTRDATFDAEPNNTEDTAQALPPAGAALGNLLSGEVDYYKFNAVRGDTILVETSTPADGLGQFINALDATVELLDPETGRWIAGDDNSPDGRNGWVRLRALSDGVYTVRVSSSGGTAGEYALNVRLNPDAAPKPLYVAATTTTPADEAITPPSAAYDLDHDGRVGLGDLALLASVYQLSVGDGGQELVGRCDFDGSGKVGLGDLARFAQHYREEVSQDAAATEPPPEITDELLSPIVKEAVARMAADTGVAAAELTAGVTVSIADLPGNLIGRTVGRCIEIDATAAGYGWFVDQTPGDDVEFAWDADAAERTALPGSEATGRADLLTAVMHELGHILGLKSSQEHDLMNVSLPLGTRRLLDEIFAEIGQG